MAFEPIRTYFPSFWKVKIIFQPIKKKTINLLKSECTNKTIPMKSLQSQPICVIRAINKTCSKCDSFSEDTHKLVHQVCWTSVMSLVTSIFWEQIPGWEKAW